MGGAKGNEHHLHMEKLSFKLEAASDFWWDGRKCHKEGQSKMDGISSQEKGIRKCLDYPSLTFHI